MLKIALTIHLLAAVFVIGPLVYTASVAPRVLRGGDAGAARTGARAGRVYGYASLIVVLAGFATMSSKRDGKTVASFGDTYIWLSLLLWLLAVAVVLAVLVPSLEAAAAAAEAGSSAAGAPGGSPSSGSTAAGGSIARVAAAGGVVSVLFAVIVVLMVYRPGG